MESRKLLDFLLVYIDDGEGSFVVDGVEYGAEATDLFWIPPATAHSMSGYAPSMVCVYAHFDLVYEPNRSHWDFTIPPGMHDLGELKPLMHPELTDSRLRSLKGLIRGQTNRRVGELLRDICAEAARAQPFAGLRMSGLMMEVVAEILRGQESSSGDRRSHAPRLEEVAGYMFRHCAEDMTMKTLAEKCELSESHFRHLFVRQFGCSPRSYLRTARLRKARELMLATSLTLSEIAPRVGFETVHSFSKAFREVEGISPSEYRRFSDVRTRVEGREVRYSR